MGSKKVLVVGLGRFGSSIVETLWELGADCVAVDESAEAVDAVKDRSGAAFVGDATHRKVLEGVGAADVDTAVVTFGEDFEAAVLCVAELRQLGVREIVVRAASQRHAAVLLAAGATRAVQIEHDMGRVVAQEMITPAAAELIDFAHGHRVIPWLASGPLLGKTLAEAELRKRYGVTVLGYRRRDAVAAPGTKPRFEVAGPRYEIAEGDTLLLVGETDEIRRFVEDQGEA